ncbi:MAG: Multidrug resistance protein MdtK [Stenotrophomonas maltophilia]|nr:MAG: Multidrug resistance protein MdtK [Stenotrophomonas maltophilia]
MMLSTLRRELSALLRLAGPLVAAQLAYVAMVFTDTVMMGRLGPEALAAGGLGAAVHAFVSTCCSGVVGATGNLVAIRFGAGDRRGVVAEVRAGLCVAAALALGAGLLLWNIGPLLKHLGQSPATVDAAMPFLRSIAFSLPGYLAFMVLRGFTSAIERSGPVMTISILGALANLLLNTAFLDGWFGLPRLGLAGIGVVTTLVMSALPLILAGYLRWHPAYADYPLLRNPGLALRPRIGETLRLGLSIGGTYAVESGMFAVATLCMGRLGSTALAAHQIAIQSVYVAFMVPVGISYAVTFRIGQHVGAGRLLEARQVGRVGVGLVASCMFGFALLFWLAPGWVIGLFLDPHAAANQPVVRLAAQLLAIAAWFELFDGTQNIAMGALRGLKDARTSFLVGLAGYWLAGVPLAWLLTFAFGWGPAGVWWGLAAGLGCTAIGLCLAFEQRMARRLQVQPAAFSGRGRPAV